MDKKKNEKSHKIIRAKELIFLALVRRLGKRFYWYLAVVISLFAVLDLNQTRLISGMQTTTYDFLMRHRINYPAPDNDIVIIDIDDASLKAMAGRFGRWPWPREVMGAVIEKLEKQKPKAIVFDILFSDQDRLNMASDERFVNNIAKFNNIFFPMVLVANNDANQVLSANVPGARRILAEKNELSSMSVLLPYFAESTPAGHIGTNNIVPDSDGVVRRFSLTQIQNGWEVPSLPLQIARALDFSIPSENSLLINWRGPPYSFNSTSFSYIYAQPDENGKSHIQDDFKNKIIVIGSTAVSLFDLKASPMASIHPGVEMLATVLDNVKRNSYLREQSIVLYAAVAMFFVWLLAFAFYAQRNTVVYDSLFVALQFGFIAISYLIMNLSNHYVDMTAPISLCIIYYTIARIYAHYFNQALIARTSYANSIELGSLYTLTVMAVAINNPKPNNKIELDQLIENIIVSAEVHANQISNIFEPTTALGHLFEDITIIYWMALETDSGKALKIADDTERIKAATLNVNLKRSPECQSYISMSQGVLRWENSPSARLSGRAIVLKAISGLRQS